MKPFSVTLAFIFLNTLVFGQQFSLKGHLLGLPEDSPIAFSVNLGGELQLPKRFSVQILAASNAVSSGASDGPGNYSRSIFNDVRYYALNKTHFNAFLGAYTEIAKKQWYGGGECFVCSSSKETQHNWGLLTGVQFFSKKHWGLELYAGLKTGKGSKTFLVSAPTGISSNVFLTNTKGFRWGGNFIYRFKV
jgi:hypothetical protein